MKTQPPAKAIAFLKEKNVFVDKILLHLVNKDPGRDGDDDTSPVLEEENDEVVEYDSGCAQCGQVHILNNSSLRNRGVLNALADNLLWEKGQKLVYHTPKEGWPSDEIYELVVSAADVAIWVWNEMDLGITLTHARNKPMEFTHKIRYGGTREGNLAANGNFPTMLNPQITLYEKAFSDIRGGRSRLLSRMIHEFGHTLGFYHEFEADPNDGRGIAIGRRDVRSIMGYHRNRTITKSDIASFPAIYRIEEGTEINMNTGARVLYIAAEPFDEPARSGDASDGRADGIIDILSPLLRMFDTNQETLDKAIETSTDSVLLPTLENNEEENAKRFERNAGILSTGLGLGLNLVTSLFRSSDEDRDGGIFDSVLNIGKSLVVDVAKGAAEGALGGLLRSSDGTGIVINKTVTPANMGVFAVKNLTETVGMRSISLLVNEKNRPSSQLNENKKIMISGEWLLSKYSQLLLKEMIEIIIADKKSQNSMDSKELMKTIAHKSIEIVKDIPLLAADVNVMTGITMPGNDTSSLIESVIKHCREDDDQLPSALKNLMLSVLLPRKDEEPGHSLFGHIADYNPKSSPRIIFYSITTDDVDGWSLMIRDVEFKYHLIYDRILKDHNNLDEVNAFLLAKNSGRHALLQGLSPKGDRGNDNNENDDGHTSHGETTTGGHTVCIIAAMVNPEGGRPENDEWVTLINFSSLTQSLKNWKLRDQENRDFSLDGEIASGDSMKIYPSKSDSSQMVLTNKGGSLKLIDMNGDEVHKVKWSNQETNEDEVIKFDN